MLSLGTLLLALACPPQSAIPTIDTAAATASRDSSAAVGMESNREASTTRSGHVGLAALPDTVRPRRRAVEMSDAAALRLQIHRYASYTMIPLFVAQSVAGNQLYQADQSGSPRPGWAKTTHGLGAAGLGALFTVNTVTGIWSLWDSRAVRDGRTKRWIHSALLLASDAGFAYAGTRLADDAKNSQSGREQHRRVALISMGTALAGYAVMFVGNR